MGERHKHSSPLTPPPWHVVCRVFQGHWAPGTCWVMYSLHAAFLVPCPCCLVPHVPIGVSFNSHITSCIHLYLQQIWGLLLRESKLRHLCAQSNFPLPSNKCLPSASSLPGIMCGKQGCPGEFSKRTLVKG